MCTGGNQGAVEGHGLLTAAVELDGERLGVLEARLAAQQRDVGVAGDDRLVLGRAQFFNTFLLLGQQQIAVDPWRRRRDADIERTGLARVGKMRRADHDLRWHTADVDAGAANGAALDEGDLGALLGRRDRRRHGAAAGADDGDVERLFGTRASLAQAVGHSHCFTEDG